MSERNSALHRRARERGVNPIVYWVVRAFFQPFFHLYFRLSRIGREHIPDGPVIFAANHRSFLDPFIIGTMSRRPLYYVAKEELFAKRLQAWFLNSLGAFPVSRGNGDKDTIETAKAILARGDSVLIFPEGTRRPPGAPPAYKYGVAHLYQNLGFPCVPIAMNSGLYWPRRQFIRRPGTVRIEVQDPIAPGLGREAFFKLVQERIETASNRLLEEGRAELGMGPASPSETSLSKV